MGKTNSKLRENQFQIQPESAQFKAWQTCLEPYSHLILKSPHFNPHPEKPLYEGHFSIIFEGTYKGQRVAVKTYKDNPELDALKAFFNELEILDYISVHRNIVKLIGAQVSSIGRRRVFTVLEFCPFGSLDKYLREHRQLATSENSIQLLCSWSHQISAAMSFLASKNIVHGDLATRNVQVFNEGTLKLANFNQAHKLLSRSSTIYADHSRPLPWKWASPETLEFGLFSSKSDVWSYGVTLWEVFQFAEQPYADRMVFDQDFVKELHDGSLRLPKPEVMPKEVYDFVLHRCFESDAAARTDFDGIEKLWVQYLTPAPAKKKQKSNKFNGASVRSAGRK